MVVNNTPQRKPRLVYSIPQSAHELGVCERTVWKLIAQQKIRSIKIGLRRTGIPATELERIAAEGTAR